MSNSHASSVHVLPNELLLKIIEQVPYDRWTFLAIRGINRHFQWLMIEYRRSITTEIARSQYPSSSAIYPLLSLSSVTQGLHSNWLAMLDHRSQTVRYIVDLILHGSLQGSVPPEDLRQWARYVEAGLHLCYRLRDCKTYETKVAFIASLPYLSLALIYVTLLWSLRTAQRLGTGLMHADHGPSIEEQRMELCLCFEECTIQYGPDFLCSMLMPDYTNHCYRCNANIKAYAILKNEWDSFDERQFGGMDVTLPRRMLISCLKRAIAKKVGCTMEKVYSTAWATVQRVEILRRTYSLVDLVCAQ